MECQMKILFSSVIVVMHVMNLKYLEKSFCAIY